MKRGALTVCLLFLEGRLAEIFNSDFVFINYIRLLSR
jgi:hypothetical protein